MIVAYHCLKPSMNPKFSIRWLWTYYHYRANMAISGIILKQKFALAV
ncbi:Uncharacterised protein [Janthinobacterium lividum]|nr:Uncharacterised protein [Janthinobacterium lividum]